MNRVINQYALFCVLSFGSACAPENSIDSDYEQRSEPLTGVTPTLSRDTISPVEWQPALPIAQETKFVCDRESAPPVRSGRLSLAGSIESCDYYGPNLACPIPPDFDLGPQPLNLANFCGMLAAHLIKWPFFKGFTPTVELKVCVGGAAAMGCTVEKAVSAFDVAQPKLRTDGAPIALELLDELPRPCTYDPGAQCLLAAAPGATATTHGLTTISIVR